MDALATTIQKLKDADARRPDFPGEHLAVLGAGLALLLASGRSRSFLKRTLAGAAGGALIGRAATGTGGLTRLMRVLNASPRVQMIARRLAPK
ncbi:hypothetical protein [Variovorax brevis]|uniref:hypothetical protein n=1 Tax=Variovorax brevis TaxID=3053503 RepID=UPI002575640A|nr:hypothetical protein [Variovorax sp. J22R133]